LKTGVSLARHTGVVPKPFDGSQKAEGETPCERVVYRSGKEPPKNIKSDSGTVEQPHGIEEPKEPSPGGRQSLQRKE